MDSKPMSLICSVCKKPIDDDNGWVVWPHTEDAQLIEKLKKVHSSCREAFIKSLSTDKIAKWSLVHLQDLPSSLIDIKA